MIAITFTATPAPAAFTDAEVERVLAYGLRAIETRALEPIALLDITLEGLRGLSTLDASFSISSQPSGFSLIYAGQDVGHWRHPKADSVNAWANTALDIIKAAQKRSAVLARMDAEDLYQAFFDSALAPLDPFSRYAGRAEAEQQQERRNGFGGIGVRYRLYRHYLEVTSVLEGTPAEEQDIQPGDRITAIGAVPIDNLPRKSVHDLLRGPVDSKIDLTITRNGVPRNVSLHRSLVSTPTAFISMAGDIPRLKVTRFSQQTVALSRRLIEETLAGLKTPPPGLILDLRGNPGGLLDQAVGLSDLFMSEGGVVSTRGRHPQTEQDYHATKTDVPGGDILNGLPILVLVDGRTASAAEIVAAALQSDNRAVVVGTTSYGKGTVQTVVAMPNGGELTLTWSRFFTPAGYALHGLGVMPSICTAEHKTTPEQVMRDLYSGHLPTMAYVAQWRQVRITDSEERHRLRQACPPEDHGNRDALDLDIAQAILLTPGAYRSALTAMEIAAATENRK